MVQNTGIYNPKPDETTGGSKVLLIYKVLHREQAGMEKKKAKEPRCTHKTLHRPLTTSRAPHFIIQKHNIFHRFHEIHRVDDLARSNYVTQTIIVPLLATSNSDRYQTCLTGSLSRPREVIFCIRLHSSTVALSVPQMRSNRQLVLHNKPQWETLWTLSQGRLEQFQNRH